MKKSAELEYIDIENLKLDFKNPRFAELYSGSSEEDDLIEYLLHIEAAKDVAKAIINADEFYEDKALWVLKDHDDKYLVKDGNRRCAAVKALQMPGKYGLTLTKTVIDKLPVYIYTDIKELDDRIVEEHAGGLFRRWERIAKALEVHKLFNAGAKVESMLEIDSSPADLIRLASFYYEAVKVGGDELKILLRRGRGKDAGKTIVFERLFKYADECGYHFKRKPAFVIQIDNRTKFNLYVRAVIDFLIDTNENITADYIDKKAKDFFEHLKKYGFTKSAKIVPVNDDGLDSNDENGQGSGDGTGRNTGSTADGSGSANGSGNGGSTTGGNGTGRGSTKKYPDLKRKKRPSGLQARIDEYFKIIDSNTAPNAKIAMTRITYECVLKYIVENTHHVKIKFSNSGHFGSAYRKKPYTDFDELNKKFIELIINTGYKKAFENFEFEKMHQIIHNYHTSGKTIDADQLKDNFIPLIEFMLQDETDLLNSLDLTKIK